jgi:ankyrin repeat protein
VIDAQRTLDLKLVDACKRGRLNQVPSLVAQGASPQATTKAKISLLHWAAQAGKDGVIEALVAAGADVHNDKDSGPRTDWDASNLQPIHIAARHGRWTTVALLIDLGANPNATDKNGQTPLHLCAHRDVLLSSEQQAKVQEGQTAAARVLIARGANVNATTNPPAKPPDVIAAASVVGFWPYRGSTPLLIAAYHGMVPLFGTLLSQGANPDVGQGAGGKTVLQVIQDGDPKLIERMKSLMASNAAMRAIDAMTHKVLPSP